MGMKIEIDLAAVSDEWGDTIQTLLEEELRKELNSYVKSLIKKRHAELEAALHAEVDRWLEKPEHQEALTALGRQFFPEGSKSNFFKEKK